MVPAQPAPLYIANVNGTAAARIPPASRAPPPGRKLAAGSSTAGVPPARPPASKGGPVSTQGMWCDAGLLQRWHAITAAPTPAALLTFRLCSSTHKVDHWCSRTAAAGGGAAAVGCGFQPRQLHSGGRQCDAVCDHRVLLHAPRPEGVHRVQRADQQHADARLPGEMIQRLLLRLYVPAMPSCGCRKPYAGLSCGACVAVEVSAHAGGHAESSGDRCPAHRT